MPASPVCIGVTYADGKHMRMFALCRCVAYGYAAHILFSHFFTADPKKASYGSSSPSAQRYIPSAQHVVPHTVAHGTICCVVSLDCDAPRRGGKQRYDDFLSVVHFRKVVYSNKVGSIRNGNAVITLCFYKSDFNFYWLT